MRRAISSCFYACRYRKTAAHFCATCISERDDPTSICSGFLSGDDNLCAKAGLAGVRCISPEVRFLNAQFQSPSTPLQIGERAAGKAHRKQRWKGNPRRHRGAPLSAGPANFRDHAITDLANFATLSSWRTPTPPGRRQLGNRTSPAPCDAGHLFTNACRAKARPRAGTGLEPRVRSGFAITACITTKTLSAPHASHGSIPMRRALGSYIGYAVTPPRTVFRAAIQGIAAETSSRILADLANPAKASQQGARIVQSPLPTRTSRGPDETRASAGTGTRPIRRARWLSAARAWTRLPRPVNSPGTNHSRGGFPHEGTDFSKETSREKSSDHQYACHRRWLWCSACPGAAAGPKPVGRRLPGRLGRLPGRCDGRTG